MVLSEIWLYQSIVRNKLAADQSTTDDDAGELKDYIISVVTAIPNEPDQADDKSKKGPNLLSQILKRRKKWADLACLEGSPLLTDDNSSTINFREPC